MQRNYSLYLEDILTAACKILEFTKGLSYRQFRDDEKTFDAVVRNLEVIGEAAKKIPDDLRKARSQIEWKKIAGLRDILIHEYFGIDAELVWDIVQNKIPELISNLKK